MRRISSPQQESGCNIVFVSASEEGNLRSILEAAQRYSVLTVSNIRHFTERGGDIGLISQQDRIRFEVNRGSAAKCGLVFSSELLKVAVRVIDEGNRK